MKTRDIARFIARANKKHDEFRSLCGVLATEAQRYVEWGQVTCDMFPSDGLCLVAEPDGFPSVVPIESFFYHVRKNDNVPITPEEFKNLSI